MWTLSSNDRLRHLRSALPVAVPARPEQMRPSDRRHTDSKVSPPPVAQVVSAASAQVSGRVGRRYRGGRTGAIWGRRGKGGDSRKELTGLSAYVDLCCMSVRLSPATVQVLQALMEKDAPRQYGYSLMRATGLKSGSLYPILERLESAGWVESEWETIDEQKPGRPPRRYYRLTGFGHETAPREIQEYLRRAQAPSGSKRRPAWGAAR
jgi:PadR family transcriptional regulator PadR